MVTAISHAIGANGDTWGGGSDSCRTISLYQMGHVMPVHTSGALTLATSTFAICLGLCLEAPNLHAGRMPGFDGVPMGRDTTCGLDNPRSTEETCNNAIDEYKQSLALFDYLHSRRTSPMTDALYAQSRLETEGQLSNAYSTLRALKSATRKP